MPSVYTNPSLKRSVLFEKKKFFKREEFEKAGFVLLWERKKAFLKRWRHDDQVGGDVFVFKFLRRVLKWNLRFQIFFGVLWTGLSKYVVNALLPAYNLIADSSMSSIRSFLRTVQNFFS